MHPPGSYTQREHGWSHQDSHFEGAPELTSNITMEMQSCIPANPRTSYLSMPWDPEVEGGRNEFYKRNDLYKKIKREFLAEIDDVPLSSTQKQTLAEIHLKLAKRNDWLPDPMADKDSVNGG